MLSKEDVLRICDYSVNDDVYELRHELAQFIDQTLLDPHSSIEQYKEWIDLNAHEGFASLCVPPAIVSFAAEKLKDSETKLCSVLNFPLGFGDVESVSMQAVKLVETGVDELDMVMPYGAFIAGEYGYVQSYIEQVYAAALHAWQDVSYRHNNASDSKEATQALVFKVILECSELSDKQICIASDLISSVGVDFLKTSTGFSKSGANVHDVVLMSESKEPHCQIKASGGIRTLESLISFVHAGVTRIGCSKGREILLEFDELFSDEI